MLHEIETDADDFVEVLTPLALEHERIPLDAAAREAATIARYLGGAIQATVNYLDKDLRPTKNTYSGGVNFPFVWTRGNVRSVAAKIIDPDNVGQMIDAPTQPTISGRKDLRGATMTVGSELYLLPVGGLLVIESGFVAAEDLPDDVVEFILSVFGTHYALRESSNYSSMVFNVDNYPKYLLDPYRTLSYA